MEMNREQLARLLARAEPHLKRWRYPILVLFAGLVLLTLGRSKPADTPVSPPESEALAESFDLAAFEERLAQTLGRIDGVGRVQLTLSLNATEEAVYAADVRQSQTSAETALYESNLSIVSDGSYGQQPILVKNIYPTFRGALVLCDGADNDRVRLAVTEAVSTMCGVGSDKVTVLKMRSGT